VLLTALCQQVRFGCDRQGAVQTRYKTKRYDRERSSQPMKMCRPDPSQLRNCRTRTARAAQAPQIAALKLLITRSRICIFEGTRRLSVGGTPGARLETALSVCGLWLWIQLLTVRLWIYKTNYFPSVAGHPQAMKILGGAKKAGVDAGSACRRPAPHRGGTSVSGFTKRTDCGSRDGRSGICPTRVSGFTKRTDCESRGGQIGNLTTWRDIRRLL